MVSEQSIKRNINRRAILHAIQEHGPLKRMEFSEVCRVVLALSNLTFVIEEIHYFANARGYKTPYLETIICGGRHQGIGLIVLTRRPSTTHADLKSNASYIVIFNMTYNLDIEYVGEWIGLSKTEYAKIKELPKYHSLLYDVDEGTIREQGKCPYYGER